MWYASDGYNPTEAEFVVSSWSSYLHSMTKAVEKAAVGVVRDFGEIERLQSARTNLSQFAINTYRRAEDNLRYVLAKAYPDIGFYDGGALPLGLFWVINPVSGSQNFERSVPFFSIAVSLCKGTEVLAGIALDPVKGEYFKAEMGAGAFAGNKNRLRVSQRTTLRGALVALQASPEAEVKICENMAFVRKTGDIVLDLAYLAAGKFDACVAFDRTYPEVVLGFLLVKEAGGFIDFTKNNEGTYRILAASSIEIMKKLLSFYNIK